MMDKIKPNYVIKFNTATFSTLNPLRNKHDHVVLRKNSIDSAISARFCIGE